MMLPLLNHLLGSENTYILLMEIHSSSLRTGFKSEVLGLTYFSGTLMFLTKIFLWSCPLPHPPSKRVLKTWVHFKKLERKYLSSI